MKLLIGGMMLLFLVFAAGCAREEIAKQPPAEQPPAQQPPIAPIEQPPVEQPPAQPPQGGLYKATQGQVTVSCPPEWKDVADKLAAKINTALEKPIAKFGLETKVSIDLQLAVLPPDKMQGIVPQPMIDETHGIVHFVLPLLEGTEKTFDVTDLKSAGYIFSYCLTPAYAMELPAVQPEMLKSFPKWFWMGFNAYCCGIGAKELLGDESYKLYESSFGEKKLEVFNEKLLTWNWKEKLDTDGYFGAVCAEIFIQIEKKYGAEALVKIGKGVAAAEKADKDALVKVISDATGEDFAAWLKNFKCTKKYVQLGTLGDGTYAGPGIRVDKIFENTAAAEAGLAAGDIILKLNGEEVKDNSQFGILLNKIGIEGEAKFLVKRGDGETELTVKLRERVWPAEPFQAFPAPPPPTPQDQGPVG
jgi:hypothetical protein